METVHTAEHTLSPRETAVWNGTDLEGRDRNKPWCLIPGQVLQEPPLSTQYQWEQDRAGCEGQSLNPAALLWQPWGKKRELKPMWMYRSFRTHQSSLARRFLMLLNLSNISQQHELFQYLPMGWFRGLDVVTTTVLYPFPLILMSEKDNPAQGTEHWSRCQHSEPVFIHGNYKRCLTFLCWSVS